MIYISKNNCYHWDMRNATSAGAKRFIQFRKWVVRNRGRVFFYFPNHKNPGVIPKTWGENEEFFLGDEEKGNSLEAIANKLQATDIKWGILEGLESRGDKDNDNWCMKEVHKLHFKTPMGHPGEVKTDQVIMMYTVMSVEELLTHKHMFARLLGLATLRQQAFIKPDNVPKKIYKAMEESSTSEYVQACWDHCRVIGYKAYRNFYHDRKQNVSL
jgi:hypothetical protein